MACFKRARFLAKAEWRCENPLRDTVLQLTVGPVISFRSTCSLNRTRVGILGLNNHRSKVLWVLPCLSLLKSRVRFAFFLFLLFSVFLRLAGARLPSGVLASMALAWSDRVRWECFNLCFLENQSRNSGVIEKVRVLSEMCPSRDHARDRKSTGTQWKWCVPWRIKGASLFGNESFSTWPLGSLN